MLATLSRWRPRVQIPSGPHESAEPAPATVTGSSHVPDPPRRPRSTSKGPHPGNGCGPFALSWWDAPRCRTRGACAGVVNGRVAAGEFITVRVGRSTRGTDVTGVTESRWGSGEHEPLRKALNLICAIVLAEGTTPALAPRSPQGTTDPVPRPPEPRRTRPRTPPEPRRTPPQPTKRTASDPAESDAVLVKRSSCEAVKQSGGPGWGPGQPPYAVSYVPVVRICRTVRPRYVAAE